MNSSKGGDHLDQIRDQIEERIRSWLEAILLVVFRTTREGPRLAVEFSYLTTTRISYIFA